MTKLYAKIDEQRTKKCNSRSCIYDKNRKVLETTEDMLVRWQEHNGKFSFDLHRTNIGIENINDDQVAKTTESEKNTISKLTKNRTTNNGIPTKTGQRTMEY